MSLLRGSWLGYIMGNVFHGNGLLFLITVKGTQSTVHPSHLLSTLSTYAGVSSSWFVFHGLSCWNLRYMLFTQIKQHARKVMFDSLGLVDFVIRLMNFVLYLPNVQSNFIVITNWLFFRLVIIITFQLVHASYSFKTDFLCTLTKCLIVYCYVGGINLISISDLFSLFLGIWWLLWQVYWKCFSVFTDYTKVNS